MPDASAVDHHFLQELGSDLVAQSARAAVDGDDDVVLRQAEDLGNFRIEDFRDRLHLEIVVARAERAHLAALAFLGALGDAVGPGVRHLPLFLDAFEVACVAPAAFDRPVGAAGEHGIHLDGIERDRAFAADAGRDLAE